MTPRDGELAVPAPGKAGAVPSEGQARQAVVRLPGEIDISNDCPVRDALTRALDDGTAVLVADAAKTTFCGCSGVSVLIGAHHQAAASGGQLRIVASPALLRMLTLTGADTVLDTYPTLTAALAGRPRSPATPRAQIAGYPDSGWIVPPMSQNISHAADGPAR